MGSLVGPCWLLTIGLSSRSMCSSVSVAIVFNIVSWCQRRVGLVWPCTCKSKGVGLVRLVVGFPWESSVRLVECLPDDRFVCSRLFSGSTAIFVVNSSVEALQ